MDHHRGRSLVYLCTVAIGLLGCQDRQFPKLHDHRTIAPATTDYNCFAWSLGVTDRWLWPGHGTLAETDELNAKYGYRRLPTLDYSPGDKLIVYGVDGVVRHQIGYFDGQWTSKIGEDRVIAFDDPEMLSSQAYGEPMAVYER